MNTRPRSGASSFANPLANPASRGVPPILDSNRHGRSRPTAANAEDGALERSIVRRGAQVFVFVCFFPYPAIFTIGSSVGIQLGQLIGIVVALSLFTRVVKTRSWNAYLVLTIPLLFTYALLHFLDRYVEPDLAFKGVLSLSFALLCLPAFGAILNDRRPVWLVTPVSLAVLVHVAVGLMQLRGFSDGSFFLLDYLRNPTFMDLALTAPDYVEYVRRPFGAFPEPSAMAAAIGPWIVWLLHQGLSKHDRRALPLAASVCGSALILLSGSAYSPFVIAGVVAVVLLQPGLRAVWKGTLSAAGIALVTFSLSTTMWVQRSLGENASRDHRLGSIQEALRLPFEDSLSLLLGRGIGQVGSIFAQLGLPYVATFSLMALGFATGGIVFLAAALLVALMVARRLQNGPMRVVALMLLTSFAVTTSYVSLLPMWLMLALLLDAAVEPPGEAAKSPDLRARVPTHARGHRAHRAPPRR